MAKKLQLHQRREHSDLENLGPVFYQTQGYQQCTWLEKKQAKAYPENLLQ